MSYKVNKVELVAVSNLPAPQRYDYSIRKVGDWGEVWSVRDDNGWRLYADDLGTQLVPVWPAEAFAEACCTGDWQGCYPKSIPLADWLDRWVPGMMKDGRKVAVFPLPSDRGVLVEPDRTASDIRSVMEDLIDPAEF